MMPVLNVKDIKVMFTSIYIYIPSTVVHLKGALFSTEDVCLDAVALCQELAAEAALAGLNEYIERRNGM